MFVDLARNLAVTTVPVVPEKTREVFREGWELEGREAAHVDHMTDDLVRLLKGIVAAMKNDHARPLLRVRPYAHSA